MGTYAWRFLETATIRVRVKTEVNVLYPRYDASVDYRDDDDLLTVLTTASLVDLLSSMLRLDRRIQRLCTFALILGCSGSSHLRGVTVENVVTIESGATTGNSVVLLQRPCW